MPEVYEDYEELVYEGFFSREWITDLTVKDIVDRQNINQQLKALDSEIVRVANVNGVLASQLPVDEDGFITSPSLVSYAKFWIYHTLLSDFWFKQNDIYEKKLEYYTTQMNNTMTLLSEANILGATGKRSYEIQQKVIY